MSRGFREARAGVHLAFRRFPEGPQPLAEMTADSDSLAVDTGHHLLPALTLHRSVPQCGEFWLKCPSCLEHKLDTLLHELL